MSPVDKYLSCPWVTCRFASQQFDRHIGPEAKFSTANLFLLCVLSLILLLFASFARERERGREGERGERENWMSSFGASTIEGECQL